MTTNRYKRQRGMESSNSSFGCLSNNRAITNNHNHNDMMMNSTKQGRRTSHLLSSSQPVRSCPSYHYYYAFIYCYCYHYLVCSYVDSFQFTTTTTTTKSAYNRQYPPTKINPSLHHNIHPSSYLHKKQQPFNNIRRHDGETSGQQAFYQKRKPRTYPFSLRMQNDPSSHSDPSDLLLLSLENSIYTGSAVAQLLVKEEEDENQMNVDSSSNHLATSSTTHFRKNIPYINTPAREIEGNLKMNHNIQDGYHDLQPFTISTSRRSILQRTALILAAGGITSSVINPMLPALAGIAEIDTVTGNLYTPKNDMLSGGGSVAARGISVEQSQSSLEQQPSRIRRPTITSTNSIYETRFVAYLSRFLLNYDPSLRAWWVQQNIAGTSYSWDNEMSIGSSSSSGSVGGVSIEQQPMSSPSVASLSETVFAEFAQSVEVGLFDYFSGPFGSYSSVPAAIAGLNAVQPAPSKQTQLKKNKNKNDDQKLDLQRLLQNIFQNPMIQQKEQSVSTISLTQEEKMKQQKLAADISIKNAKQGILNLYAILKVRYNSISAKRQLAILFSFVSSPLLQPTMEISSLLGEIDNTTVTQINLVKPPIHNNVPESLSRTSPRRGGGYSLLDPLPTITIDGPAPLGDNYRPALARPVMKCTSRILRIKVIDGGEGYYSEVPPTVTIIPWGSGGIVTHPCNAIATLNREGQVDSIVVLDPGYGYTDTPNGPPTIRIDLPTKNKSSSLFSNPSVTSTRRRARAVAELEYEIIGIDILQGGNGYVRTEPPNVLISPPPTDPDWFLYVQEQPELRMVSVPDTSIQEQVYGLVSEMKFADGNIAYCIDRKRELPGLTATVITNELIQRLRRDPLELLPSSIRPEYVVPDDDLDKTLVPQLRSGISAALRRKLKTDWDSTTYRNNKLIYSIPVLSSIPQNAAILSPRYRACDPVFGGVGQLPVTKSASALSASEYGRLALSGAVCTVLVRTLLNPLELVKTKQQLQNDDELFNYARQKKMRQQQQQEQPKSSSVVVIQKNGLANVTKTPSTVTSTSPISDVVISTSKGPSYSSSPSTNVAVAEKPSKTVAAIMPLTQSSTTLVTITNSTAKPIPIGTIELIQAIIELRGPFALFQSADITFLASLVFGSFGFGATELFRRSFTTTFGDAAAASSASSSNNNEIVLLFAAAVATIVTAAAASPFELLRVRSMGTIEAKKWTKILQDFIQEDKISKERKKKIWFMKKDDELKTEEPFDLRKIKPTDLLPLWAGFAPTLSRELPFAVAKFLTFDLIATTIIGFINTKLNEQGSLPIQVGVGPIGLTISAFAGAFAGIAGAFVSHPADLILTKTSASKKQPSDKLITTSGGVGVGISNSKGGSVPVLKQEPLWIVVVKDLISSEGGFANLFVGLGARSVFFFLVIGLQFFLYDYVKGLFQVGSDDLSLVLDVFYAVRAGLLGLETDY